MPSLPGQRNSYKGREPRCWLRLRFAALDGSLHERDLLADTGSPCAVILANTDLLHLMQAEADPIGTNFGAMAGAWLKLAMPEFAVKVAWPVLAATRYCGRFSRIPRIFQVSLVCPCCGCSNMAATRTPFGFANGSSPRGSVQGVVIPCSSSKTPSSSANFSSTSA